MGQRGKLILSSLEHYCIPLNLDEEEMQGRDGFQMGNADKVFKGTSSHQLTRKVARMMKNIYKPVI